MPRFVILEHDHPELHWDFMLEKGTALETWRLARSPQPGVAIEAIALGDHRALYLNYEGPVSSNRGVVKRWDAGDFTEAEESSPEARRFSLEGERVCGNVVLTKVAKNHWRFEWST